MIADDDWWIMYYSNKIWSYLTCKKFLSLSWSWDNREGWMLITVDFFGGNWYSPLALLVRVGIWELEKVWRSQGIQDETFMAKNWRFLLFYFLFFLVYNEVMIKNSKGRSFFFHIKKKDWTPSNFTSWVVASLNYPQSWAWY